MKKLSLYVALFASIMGATNEAQACYRCAPAPRPMQMPIAQPVPVPVPVPRPVPVPVPVPTPVPVQPMPMAQPCAPMPCMGTHGFAPGAFGVMRPAWFGPVGRYPKLFFRAPLRRGLGLPGFTPLRQFAFGRGAIRRQTRRGAIFGRCFRTCC